MPQHFTVVNGENRTPTHPYLVDIFFDPFERRKKTEPENKSPLVLNGVSFSIENNEQKKERLFFPQELTSKFTKEELWRVIWDNVVRRFNFLIKGVDSIPEEYHDLKEMLGCAPENAMDELANFMVNIGALPEEDKASFAKENKLVQPNQMGLHSQYIWRYGNQGAPSPFSFISPIDIEDIPPDTRELVKTIRSANDSERGSMFDGMDEKTAIVQWYLSCGDQLNEAFMNIRSFIKNDSPDRVLNIAIRGSVPGKEYRPLPEVVNIATGNFTRPAEVDMLNLHLRKNAEGKIDYFSIHGIAFEQSQYGFYIGLNTMTMLGLVLSREFGIEKYNVMYECLCVAQDFEQYEKFNSDMDYIAEPVHLNEVYIDFKPSEGRTHWTEFTAQNFELNIE